MTKIKHILTAILLITSGVYAFAQETIKGKVTDETDAPLPGTFVMETGSGDNGVVTDADGSYTITLKSKGDLQFSFMSYRTQTIKVNGRSIINVKMEPDAIQLETAVAIGYGTAKKADLTGAVTVVDVQSAQEAPLQDIGQMLQGRVAGADIMSGSGELGESASILIRGSRSITAGNEPLIIVDGVMNAVTSLSDINTNDIESISVLKDASSTAIYGAQGANGVIIITTKTGENSTSKANVSLGIKAGFSELFRTLDLMNAEEFARFNNERQHYNKTSSPTPGVGYNPEYVKYPNKYLDPSALGEGTDWIDAMTYPYSSRVASTPIASSSSRSIFRRLSSLAALGCDVDSGSDCVSTATYLRNLSKIFSILHY